MKSRLASVGRLFWKVFLEHLFRFAEFLQEIIYQDQSSFWSTLQFHAHFFFFGLAPPGHQAALFGMQSEVNTR